jgi:hypothetical protein
MKRTQIKMQASSTCSVSQSNDCFGQCDAGGLGLDSSCDTHNRDGTNEILNRVYRPHGALARTLYYKYLADERLQRYDRTKVKVLLFSMIYFILSVYEIACGTKLYYVKCYSLAI